MTTLSETTVELAAQGWFQALGYEVLHGPQIAPGEPGAERTAYSDVVLLDRLRSVVARLNPDIPPSAQEDAIRKALRPESPSLVGINRHFHKILREGVEVEFKRPDGTIKGDRVRLVDFDDPGNNDWLVVNQFTVIQGEHNRRPDIVVFLNGLPIAVIEMKNAADENATIWSAWNQIQTYKNQIPSLFHFNELLIVSDGLHARIGSLTAGREWFKIWRSLDGEPAELELETLIREVFDRRRLLELLRHFIVFEDDTDSDEVHKILAGYHQYHAVREAVAATVEASQPQGDRRCGVVWHTQGSGKSLSMLFYAGRIVLHPAMDNPTLVLLTDRNDLDDQLFGQFQRCYEILRQKPVQAESVQHLRELLKVASGGVVFTTIQKFMPDEKNERMPLLSDRHNIVVIADEAHRSQYDFIDGLARNMRDALPNASFIGFTGTPIEKTDANTRAVFGDYVSVYDIEQAVKDNATVPIYYESRIAKLALSESELPKLDTEFEEITEGEEITRKEKLKTKWAALEALVGTEKRLKLIAADLVDHFEKRLEAMDGKAMIVCMSRRICVDMYNAITAIRPEWASAEDDSDEGKGTVVKVVMTGAADDPPEWQPHIRTKEKRRKLAARFKKPSDPFRIVIVRDMWLTGFDAPSLHTMYVDKPMRGHGLMQAIARVNRVFRDKPGGLVVDYLGLADQLKRALAVYTESGGHGRPSIDESQAVEALLQKYEVCCDMMHLPAPPPSPFYVYAIECEDGSFYIGQTDNLMGRWHQHKKGTGADWTRRHRPVRIAHYELAQSREQALQMESDWKTGHGRKRLKRLVKQGGARQAGGFDWSDWTSGTPEQRLRLLPPAQEHILEQEGGKDRFTAAVRDLSHAFALCATHDEAIRIRDDIAFFQAVRIALLKRATAERSPEEIDHAVRQLVSKAIMADEGIIDVFTAAGLKKPDISILSDEFLTEVRGLPQRNLAVELLEKLLKEEVRTRSRSNVVQARMFSEMLKQSLNKYHNRAIATQQIIDELINLAKEMREARDRGEELGLNDDEVAFYDALEVNDSAVKVLGEPTLKQIARELVEAVRNNATIDWNLRESVRAKMRVIVKRILRKYGYPPDKQEAATRTVLEQAELLCATVTT